MSDVIRSGAAAPMRPAETEQSFRLLVESVKDYAIFMLDPQGIITTWNAGAERLKGYRASEIIGRHFSIFYTPEDRAAGRPERSLERALAEGRYEDEDWRVRKDGSLFCADIVITPLFDESGEHKGYAKVTRDLTEQRRAEEERMRLAHAEEAVRIREEFISVAAHELRTPLNALKLQVAGLKLVASRERDASFDREQVASRVDRLLRLTDRLANLIERLLDVSRLGIGRISIEQQRMDLVACARDVLTLLETAARHVKIEFRAPQELFGEWDPMRMEQVVYNLLENAIDYGDGAPIEVTLRRESEAAVLDVVDQGPGIAEKDRNRIFERFASGEPPSHRKGLGLGLYITRAIVEAHGGVIELAPTESGAHFRIRLPIQPATNAGDKPRG